MNKTLHSQFIEPSNEFTPIPFWFWNDALTHDELKRQIHDFYDKGVMGFVLHPRIGIPTSIEYLSDPFMDYVATAVCEADKLGMTVILYDEAMYPSGAAKGLVVKDNPEFASRGLEMVEFQCDGSMNVPVQLNKDDQLISVLAIEKDAEHNMNPNSTMRLEVTNETVSFNPPNENQWSIVMFIETFSNGNIRGIHFGEDDGEEHAPASADLLNPKAVEKFIRLTHERYYQKLSFYFGTTIQAMFTDEPDILGRGGKKGLQPWTQGFLTWYEDNGGSEVDLPMLWLEAGDQTTIVRKRFEKAINKRLSVSYYQPLSEWCERHQIALTGHPEASDDIGMLEHFQIPGQDVVWRWVGPEDQKAIEGAHSTAGKCSSDAARHRGRRRNLNEVLGVCSKESDWDLHPGDMKWYLDWLFVRGVNMISPHAFYYSIEGKRRSHERPPDVGPNNSWWPYFSQFSTYMKRLSWLMTDSVNKTEIAVLCGENHLPWKIVKPLYENQMEFNYLEEALFQTECTLEDGSIRIQKQSYKVILIEDASTLDDATKKRVETFIEQGGLAVVGNEGSQKGEIQGAKSIESLNDVCDAIDLYQHREITLGSSCKDMRVSHVQKAGSSFYLIVNEGEETYKGTITFRGVGSVEKWNAWDGTIEEVEAEEIEESQTVSIQLDRRESIIYRVNPNGRPSRGKGISITPLAEEIAIDGEWMMTGDLIREVETKLQAWGNWREMECYSGTVTYSQSFELDQQDTIEKAIIDLGEVHEIAKLWINEIEIGVKMWAPYTFELHDVLKKGINTIKIEVTNSKANQMDQVNLPSGLLGPVKMNVFS